MEECAKPINFKETDVTPPLRSNLTGQCAFVSGASSGLGRRFALVLAKAGAKVAIAARRADKLQELQREIEAFDGRAIPIALDVRDAESVHKAIAHTETELGAITILVNNAGIAIPKPFLETNEADWDQILGTNLKGAWLLAKEVAQHMARHGHGGSIINIASIISDRVIGHHAVYGAAKAGLVHLTKAMANELARHGIRVNAIAPGYIVTEMNQEFFASGEGEKIKQRIPLRRVGSPEDLDGILLLLASDASSFMTGSVVTVDGGQSVNSL
jgi:NAD(P)-dependent dehydrogenase (short-subunit alcohol dehydrogenase family)